MAELCQFREAAKKFVILLEAFAEADAGVDDDLRFWDTRFLGFPNGSAEALRYVLQHVSRERSFLHGGGLTAHVHEDQRDAAVGGDFAETRVVFEAGDVVDDFGACTYGDFGDAGFAGVDRDGNFQLAAEGSQDREQSAEFFDCADAGGTWARGFGADVEYVGARFL